MDNIKEFLKIIGQKYEDKVSIVRLTLYADGAGEVTRSILTKKSGEMTTKVLSWDNFEQFEKEVHGFLQRHQSISS